MIDTAVVEYHGKRHSDFDLQRILKAKCQGFKKPVTAYLTGVIIQARAAVGVVYGHVRQDSLGRFADCHIIRTSDVLDVSKEGRFWVLRTENSRYVIATFRSDGGRQSLRDFQRLAVKLTYLTANHLH
ncbi:hypothetical protein K4A76_14670 [Pseudomonas sp. NEEL19]|uniref:hypothetical protein n=1 Tax=Pseudomonas sp. NEEL19 TaxID=2867409 RepID=UPI0023674FDB|nr:hypothetical protein [Pseudomonas sp. NEEL19]WDM61691.1 hypothetical protein K4A76_14670 [Pseudomonas sp. NEEL19]